MASSPQSELTSDQNNNTKNPIPTSRRLSLYQNPLARFGDTLISLFVALSNAFGGNHPWAPLSAGSLTAGFTGHSQGRLSSMGGRNRSVAAHIHAPYLAPTGSLQGEALHAFIFQNELAEIPQPVAIILG